VLQQGLETNLTGCRNTDPLNLYKGFRSRSNRKLITYWVISRWWSITEIRNTESDMRMNVEWNSWFVFGKSRVQISVWKSDVPT